MTWSQASLAILAVALAGGFGWYERSRPSARVLALVATLAALAALGRVAFAPLPDIKPTTDIVLLAGYCLGGAPGFAVGAVAALTSNMFFGQGPWTPWQMFAWGTAGVAGAGLARLSGRRLGRVGLASACAIMGLVFGAIMNLYTWTVSGGHTVAQYAVDATAALPFDLAHAAGNVAFCLLFGPGLVRALTRFSDRMRVRWRPVGTTMVVALCAISLGALAPGLVPAARASAHTRVLARGLAFLRSAQNADGGLGSDAGESSTPLFSAWTAMGVAAAGRSPKTLHHRGRSLAQYILSSAGEAHSLGDIERTMLALRASGLNASRVGHRSLAGDLLRRQAADGSFSGQANLTAFGILALRATGRPPSGQPLRRAGRWLVRQQNADGSFSFAQRGQSGDIDDTAGALQALIALGRQGVPIYRGIRFLRARQNSDGGFPLQPGGPSNAQSTSWAVQALLAAHQRIAAVRRGSSHTPLEYLRSLMAPNGSIQYSRTSGQTPVWVTAQALTALGGSPLPVTPVRSPAAPRRRALGRMVPPPSRPARAAAAPRPPRTAGGRAARASRRPPLGPRRIDHLARRAGAAAGLLLAPLVS